VNRVSANREDTNPNPNFGESGFGKSGRHHSSLFKMVAEGLEEIQWSA